MADVTHLNNRLWGKLPHDIIYIIIEHLDISSQKCWACVSQEFYGFLCAKIWHTITIKGSQLDEYLNGRRSRTLKATEGLLHNLIHNPYRPDPNLVFEPLRKYYASQEAACLSYPQGLVRIPLLELPL